MDIKELKIGIIHSLIGKNDGVSIVIDQTIKAMTEQLRIPLGNLYFMAGHSAPRLQTLTNDILWHRNDTHKYILKQFSSESDDELEELIIKEVKKAKELIYKFVEKNELDLLIVHNGCHPTNFIMAIAMGMYFEERRNEELILPKYLLWWHDSHFERERFSNPNQVIKKFMKYIPGHNVDGIVFINSKQEKIAELYCKEVGIENIEKFFNRKTRTIPNTAEIPWDWKAIDKKGEPLIQPLDQYNKDFFKDIGLLNELEKRNASIDDSVILLQHTRIVERKRIDHALKFAFKLQEKFKEKGNDKSIALIISGHSGDELGNYKEFLQNFYKEQCELHKNDRVILIFAENFILPNREFLSDKRFYSFEDIPAVVAKTGGMGTYFSEIEGYGNNLLEMLSAGLPVIINEYEIFKTDIAHLGFDLIKTENGNITDEAVEASYQLLTDFGLRQKIVRNNLKVLEEKLNHSIMADSLGSLLKNIFRYK